MSAFWLFNLSGLKDDSGIAFGQVSTVGWTVTRVMGRSMESICPVASRLQSGSVSSERGNWLGNGARLI